MSELMRRATPGLALAGAALATVWLFDPAVHPEVTPTAAASATDDDATADAGASADTTDPADTSDSSDTTDSGDAAVEEPAPATEEPAAASGDCAEVTSVTGDAVMTRWGPVQVRMDFAADGTVCGVQAIAYPDSDHRSAQINSTAIPYLDSQAIEVGVEFDSVSGATYTSEAYRQSMQSILDQR